MVEVVVSTAPAAEVLMYVTVEVMLPEDEDTPAKAFTYSVLDWMIAKGDPRQIKGGATTAA